MSFELIKRNIEREKRILSDLADIKSKLEDRSINSQDGQALMGSLVNQLNLLNKVLPDLIDNVTFYKKINADSKNNLIGVSFVNANEGDKKVEFIVKKSDEQNIKKNLQIQNQLYKTTNSKPFSGNPYIKLSNRMFRNLSIRAIDNSFFSPIKTDLRKISSPLIAVSYLSLMFFSTFIAFILALFISIPLFFLKINLYTPFLVLFLLPLVVFLLFYQYPSSQRKSYEKEINQELPFLTIYMSAVATSGIEPSKLFNILISSKDYPYSNRELKKLTNYTNFYGHDLVTALRLSSKNSPSERLSLLFEGLANTISSGGELSQFLDKHAETLLFDYKLEREKYTHVAETFMNIYISVLVAAPMVLMMLFILMNLTGFSSSLFSIGNLTVIIIFVITLLNVAFIMLLNSKQPKF